MTKMIPIPDEAIHSIKLWEGIVDGDTNAPGFQPYRDPVGLWTIGYGHLISHDPHIQRPNLTWTMQTCLRNLTIDTQRIAARPVARLITVPLHPLQFAALVSFTFNVGGGNLELSTLRRVINRGEHYLAPHQFKRWKYAQGGVKLAGLVRRRNYEAALYEQGTAALGQRTAA